MWFLSLFTAEQFPTYIRCSCFGICNIEGIIRALIAVNMMLLADDTIHIVTIITGGITIGISPIVILLEETSGKELDEIADYYKPLLDKN